MSSKQKITYCLWLNKEAEEAAKFYTGVFSNSKTTNVVKNPVDTPSGKEGTVLTATFEIEGQSFMALNGGPEFKLNPSISFFVHCQSEEEVTKLWDKLADGGNVLMPLDQYFFSKKYGWIQDKFGLSWQLMLAEGEVKQKVVPSWLFVQDVYGKAKEAIDFYTSVFKESKAGQINYYGEGMEPEKKDAIAYADFQLENQWFSIMESAGDHHFQFNEALSFVVNCDSQEELDAYWEKLSADPKAEICGWLKDKYGVSWQIVPTILPQLLQNRDPNKAKAVINALMQMKRLDIAALENAS